MFKGGLGTVAAGAVGTLLVGGATVLIMIYTGAYNVSARAGHTGVGRWALETMMRNSVQARADEQVQQFTPAMVRAGAGEYKSMCQQCHGGPGVRRAEWAEGIVPRPPELTRAASKWEPGEIHWIVKNGIKMTAMPSFGESHDDPTLWNIAAFVERLPTITSKEYASFPEGHGAATQPTSSHTHTH